MKTETQKPKTFTQKRSGKNGLTVTSGLRKYGKIFIEGINCPENIKLVKMQFFSLIIRKLLLSLFIIFPQ